MHGLVMDLRRKMGISIREISQLSGVSVATVSRVINQSGPVAQKTREKILHIMEEYNYVPDMVGKSLRTSTTNLIGIIIPDILMEPYAELIRHVQKKLQPMGIMTSVCVTDNDCLTAQVYIDLLRSQRASGILYIPEQNSTTIRNNGIPVVYLFHKPKTMVENSAVILPNLFEGTYLAIRELLALGCRRVSMFCDQRDYTANAYNGYQCALEESGITPHPEDVFLTHSLYSSKARQLTREALKHGFPYDGIFTASERITIGVMGALFDAGKQVPRDFLVIGYGNLRIFDYGLLSIPMVRLPVVAMAEAAVSTLLGLIEGRSGIKRELIFHVTLQSQKGKSTM